MAFAGAGLRAGEGRAGKATLSHCDGEGALAQLPSAGDP